MRAVYATRERVMRAADIKAAAYLTTEVDAALLSASDSVDRLCHRGDDIRPGFAPWTGSISYDWPVANNEQSYKFYLGRNSLLSLATAVSGGMTITSSIIGGPETGPPYRWLEVDQGTNAVLDFTSGVGQRSLVLTGVWAAAPLAEQSLSTWQLGSSPNSSTTTITINAPVGVGSIVRVDSERVQVTEKAWSTSGQTGSLSASLAANTLAVADGTAFLAGEELLIDAERVLVRDIAGNNLIVLRAVGGSTLAAHTTATIFYARSCTVERGALGTTAASHTSGTQVYIYKPPALIEQLTVAYALDQRAQEPSAYARTVGTGDSERVAGGQGIKSLEDRVYAAYGRKTRHLAV